MRILVATCEVDYSGRLTAHLPLAKRLVMVKADGSVSVHSDGGAYKPLNWMGAPCSLIIEHRPVDDELNQVWTITNQGSDTLRIAITEVESDHVFELGLDPGLEKDGVEKHLQELLAAHPERLRGGLTLVRREFPTAIGPVDLLCRSASGGYVAVEVKRRGDIDGVEQITRYLELLRRDPLLGAVEGIYAAQLIRPQARTLAHDRGITCVTLDYDDLRGLEPDENRLF
ncbi:MAG: endonuclease NucS [Propionibacteriaceae bacterium]|jgi:RecB family endonuclease NucS|nr:endonuclease NucS [Propionibacteriaceae bacterium]